MPKKNKYGGLNVTLIHQLREKIEELKEEKNFSTNILSAMPDGLDIVDQKGNILFMNDYFLKIFRKESIGRKCWEVYRDDKKQCKNCPLKKPIRIGKTETVEVKGIAGGKTFLISHIGIKLKNNQKALLEIFKDITERKKVQQIPQEQKELEKKPKKLRK